MRLAEHLFPDLERLAVHGLSIRVLALAGKYCSKHPHARRNAPIIVLKILSANSKGLFTFDFRYFVTTLNPVIPSHVI